MEELGYLQSGKLFNKIKQQKYETAKEKLEDRQNSKTIHNQQQQENKNTSQQEDVNKNI